MSDLDDFLTRFAAPTVWSIVGQRVVANALIRQSPCALNDRDESPPDVPEGTAGTVEDVDGTDDDCVTIFVDFGEPYGVVLCLADELEGGTT